MITSINLWWRNCKTKMGFTTPRPARTTPIYSRPRTHSSVSRPRPLALRPRHWLLGWNMPHR